ncbi:hypothetical protein Tco_0637145 [Tanacetum coccineum]
MTTSSANNSVFRGFFEKQKLTGPNFIDWYRQLRIVLSIDDKLNYLEQPLPPAPVAPAGQHVAPEILAAHTAWVKGSKEIAGLMLMTMEPEIQRNLENLHANDMLKELKALFAQQAEQELLQTTRDFHACKQEEGQSVSSYVLRMKGYIDNLERLGHPVTLGLATVKELHAMLKLHEQTLNLPKNNAHALHAIRAGKVQKGKKHNKPQPSLTCVPTWNPTVGHKSMRASSVTPPPPKSGRSGMQHLQKIYNGKKAALKERYWVPEEDGTYDLERLRRGRPSYISEVNWDAQLAFWNDPKNLARAAQNKKNRAKSKVISKPFNIAAVSHHSSINGFDSTRSKPTRTLAQSQ